jgi:hypothetical protein
MFDSKNSTIYHNRHNSPSFISSSYGRYSTENDACVDKIDTSPQEEYQWFERFIDYFIIFSISCLILFFTILFSYDSLAVNRINNIVMINSFFHLKYVIKLLKLVNNMQKIIMDGQLHVIKIIQLPIYQFFI